MYVKVERTRLMMGCYVEQIADCPARNEFLLKNGRESSTTRSRSASSALQSICTDKDAKHKLDDLFRDIVRGEES